MASAPTTVTVGMTRPMFTTQLDTSSALRKWASTAASGMAIAAAITKARTACHKVTHAWPGMSPVTVRSELSAIHCHRFVGSLD